MASRTNHSVDRALSLLRLLARAHRLVRFADIQAQSGIPKGTLHSLLASLEAAEFARRLGPGIRNRPGRLRGRDGNWLVTSFLTPGQHTFTVRVITANGRVAASTVKASAAAPAAPSAAVAGTWTRVVTPADVTKSTTNEPPPAGHWRLQIGPTGWQLHDPEGGGQLFDVGYQPGASVQMRPTIEYPPYPNSNSGGFCADTDPLWTWTYSVAGHGKSLTLRPVGHDGDSRWHVDNGGPMRSGPTGDLNGGGNSRPVFTISGRLS